MTVVAYSGGVASYCAAKRVKHLNPILLFADTGMEDPDLHRFLDESSQSLGLELVRLEGETLFENSVRHHALPNNRMPFCSRELKVDRCRKWIAQNAPGCSLVFGIDFTESHRAEGIKKRWPGHECLFPLIDIPLLKHAMFDECRKDGIEIPALYRDGFPHNNCGGACVRGGHAHWRMLLDRRPDTYARWEEHENMMRQKTGKDIAFLRDRSGYDSRPLTLKELREREDYDKLDFGGCGCFLDDVA